MEHDRAFKPSHASKGGINDKTFAPFPHYQEDPKKPLTRKMELDDENAKKPFRPSHNIKSTPMPSV